MESDARFAIYALDLEIIGAFPAELDIHDAIICGTAIVMRNETGEEVRVVTADRQIQNAGVVETLW